MHMIDAETVHRLLDYESFIPALLDAHLNPVDQEDAALLQEGEHTFLTLPAWRHGGVIGAKMATVFPENAGAGRRPAVQALYALFSGKDGSPIAVIDGTAMTYRKTAADSGVGASLLARDDARTMLMVGAGGLAPHVIAAHRAARPSIDRVMIWNRSPDKAKRVGADLGAEAVDDLEAAARDADVISCATNATTPLIRGAWLKAGAHLDLIGSYTPEMTEADDEAMRRSAVYCDGRRRALEDSGEIIGAIARGAITEDDIIGDLADLAHGSCPGRETADQITVFKNAGGGHLDLMTAEILAARARLTS